MTLPAAPIAITATAGYQMAIVTWQPPPDNGGSAITSYVVTASDSTTVTVTTPPNGLAPPLQAVFPGLTNGTAYNFTVAATNGSGTGPASGASNTVTPTTLPGQLPNVLTALIAQMASDYAIYGVGNPPEFGIGKQCVAEQSDGPRIVFVPKGGQWRGPTHLGDGITTPLQVADRMHAVDTYIWGVQLSTGDATQDSISNYGVAEALMTNLVASLERLGPSCHINEQEDFPDADGANLARGCAIRLRITFLIPSPDYAEFTQTIASFPQSEAVTPPN